MCGQKLWVRDSDVNKRGRCPNCKKAFNLPAQCKQVRGLLSMDETQPVCTVFEQSKISLESAVRELLSSVGADFDHLNDSSDNLDDSIYNKATVQVEIQEEE